ncbi:type II secretion system protein [Thermodesulfatator autotrophicus]|nr:type II secretion system protein [Thermodesulfatator autotrophicus]
MGNKGLTLIELAIVLVIMGFILGLGVSMLGPLTKRAKYIESREKLDANREAIIGYIITYRKLPTANEVATIVPYSKDSTGKPFLYIYDQNLASGDICDQTSTNIKLKDPDNTTKENIAFVLVGSGINYNIQTGIASGSTDDIAENGLFTANITSDVTVKIYSQGEPDVDDFEFSSEDSSYKDIFRPEEYDDISRWVTLWELKSKICSSSYDSSK